MGIELTGILAGTGAKMKAEVGEDHVAFRGAFKAEVPFEEIVAEARGTLLVLSTRGHVVELGAGAKAGALAAKVRSPPSRLDRLLVQPGASAAVAGPFDAAFRAELGTRAVVVPGAPRQPVELLFFAAESAAQLEPMPKLAMLVAPGGTLWVVVPKGRRPPRRRWPPLRRRRDSRRRPRACASPRRTPRRRSCGPRRRRRRRTGTRPPPRGSPAGG